MSEKFRVTDIVTKNKKTDNPVLLSFQNGSLQADPSTVCFFKATDSSSRQIAAVATNNNLYRGYLNKDFASSMANHFLAIKNKTTGNVRLVQVDQASLTNEIYYKQKISTSDPLDQNLAFRKLLQNFGGKKALRVLDRNLRMKVNIEVVKGQLDKTIVDTVVDDNDELNKSMNTKSIDKIRPPFNADAKRVNEVFQLSDVIPETLLAKMDDEANAVLDANTDQLPIASEYVKDKIREMKRASEPNTGKNLAQIKALVYMDALQTLLKCKNKNLKAESLSNITERVETDIRVRFSDPNMPYLQNTRHTKDKAICYYIVLALLTSPDYEIDMGVLSTELSMPRQTVAKYAQFVHAKPVASSGKLSLRLPTEVKIASSRPQRRRPY